MRPPPDCLRDASAAVYGGVRTHKEVLMNEAEIKIIENIDKYGCQVTSVFDPKEKDPNFTYTVGITKKESQPELIILGLRSELAHWIANEDSKNGCLF